jgi:hypothetical protein
MVPVFVWALADESHGETHRNTTSDAAVRNFCIFESSDSWGKQKTTWADWKLKSEHYGQIRARLTGDDDLLKFS